MNRLRPFHGILLLALVPGMLLRASDDWPEYRGAGRTGVWDQPGVVEKFEQAELAPRWSAPIGAGYSGPTVQGSRVFVMDRLEDREEERVLCFDRETGKALWVHAYACDYREVAPPPTRGDAR